jgi:hypothetical protein
MDLAQMLVVPEARDLGEPIADPSYHAIDLAPHDRVVEVGYYEKGENAPIMWGNGRPCGCWEAASFFPGATKLAG